MLQDIKVLVHDGDPLSRAGLFAILEEHRDVTTPAEADPGATGHEREVAVVFLDGIDPTAVARLRKLVTDMDRRVVLVTSALDESELKVVLEAGVHTVVWRRQATADRMIKAIRTTSHGEGEVPPDLLNRLLAEFNRQHHDPDPAPTTALLPRELSVLQLVAAGSDTREIAEQLSYSERTVKGIMHDIMVRLQLRNRAHAVAFAVRAGYI